MMNPAALFKMKSHWEDFTRNHPKFPMFLSALGGTQINEGTVIEVSIKTADGQNLCTNVKLCESDLTMIQDLKEMAKQR